MADDCRPSVDDADGRAAAPPRGWHSRGYLPHCDEPDRVQAVTFRLADALPAHLADLGARASSPALPEDRQRSGRVGRAPRDGALGARPSSPALPEHRQRSGRDPSTGLRTGGRAPRGRVPFEDLDRQLDVGYGACVLRRDAAAAIVQNALLFGDGKRYRLLAWVVMPNHVHALCEVMAGVSLSTVVHSWKSYTAKQINRLLGATGRLWQPDYFDRYMRDDNHFEATLRYIEDNPVKAGLVDAAEAWRWGSAALRRE